MKVEKIGEAPAKFEPIELKITIETQDELCELWHRMNISIRRVMKNSNDDLMRFNDSEEYCGELWDMLDSEAIRRGLHTK